MDSTPPAPFAWGPELPVLDGPRVRLRSLHARDAGAVLEVFGDPEVMRYWSSQEFPDLAAAEAYIREIHEHFRARTLFQWGVTLRGSGRVIGTGTLFQLDRTHRRTSLGYVLGRSSWGAGLGAETVATLIRFAFEQLGLDRLEADVDPRNERSLRLLERQGFRREGYLRERFRVRDEVQDSVWLGLLRREWTGGGLSPGAPVPGATA